MANDVTRSESVQEYIRLLLELHQLIADDKGDSDAADIIRDQMDSPWKRLKSTEVQLLRGLSSDLYTIGTDREFKGKMSAAIDRRIRDAAQAGELILVLEILRTYEDELVPVYVAHWRGVCWADLGFLSVAVKFFAEASRLDPSEEFHKYLLIRAMLVSGDLREAVRIATTAIETGSMLELLYIAATALSLNALSLATEKRQDSYRLIIKAVEKANQSFGSSAPVVARRDAAAANVWLSICYDQLEMPEKALLCAHFALQCDPTSTPAAKLVQQLEKGQRRLSSDEQIAIMSSMLPSMLFGYSTVPYAYAA